MPEITIRHEYDCDEDTFWEKCVFDDEYNKKLYLEALKFPGYAVLENKDLGDKRTRKVRIDPPLGNLPGPLKKLFGDKLQYVEDGTFDKKTRRYTFTVTPSTLAEKTKTSGQLWCEKAGEKKVVRIAQIKVEVKVMLVGGMVEDRILQDLRHSYEEAARFTNEYLRAKGI